MGRVTKDNLHKWHKHEIIEERNGKIYGPYYRISRVDPLSKEYIQVYIGAVEFDIDALNENFGKGQLIERQDVLLWLKQNY